MNRTTTSIVACVLLLSQAATGQDAKSLYEEGVRLKNDKKTKEALEKFQAAIAKQPDYTEALYESGWCQNEIGYYNAAILSLRKARKAWSNVPKVFFELGYAFEKSERYDSARACYNECIRIKPDYAGAYKQLGMVAYQQDDYTTALGYFASYESNVKTEIKDYLFWYRKGFMLNAGKDYNGAITALKQGIPFKADYANFYLELGFSNTKLKQAEEAEAYFKKAIELDPKSHIPYNGIAEVYRDVKRDMEQAMTWYKKALEINSKERKACFGMGYCLNSQSRFTDALPYLKTAVEQEPTYTAAWVELGYTQYALGNYTEALTSLNKALTLNNANENARYYACLVYIKQGNRAQAQKMVDELKSLGSRYAAMLQPKVDGM